MTQPPSPASVIAEPRAVLPRRDVVVHFIELRAPDREARRFETSVWVRAVLGERLGVSPSDLEFTRRCGHCGGEHGRPELAGRHRRAVAFSLSHTGGFAGLAVTDAGRVGVDIEAIRPASFLREALSSGERARMGDQPDDRRLIGLWVRKEALVKLSGLGLYLSPRALTVDGPSSVCSVTSDDGRVLTCGLADLDAPSGTRGAVALEDAIPHVVLGASSRCRP